MKPLPAHPAGETLCSSPQSSGQILLPLAGGAQTGECAELHPASLSQLDCTKRGGLVEKNKNDLKHHVRL